MEKKRRFPLGAFERMGDIMLCSILFVLCGIPIVTIGASATAMHYALRRCHDESGSLIKDFFSSFLRNFRQATCIWLILVAVGAVIVVNFWLVQEWTGEFAFVVQAALCIMSLLTLAEAGIAFPMLARFDNTVGSILKNSLMVAVFNPPQMLLSVAITALPVVLSLILPEMFSLIVAVWTLALCGAGAYLIQLLIIPIFNRMEHGDKKSEEE